MKRINLLAVPTDESTSPKGRYRRFSQDISEAMRQGNGEKSRATPWPFDVELVRLPPRAVNWPYHAHSAQWEFYMIVAGRGQVRTPAGTTDVREGDYLLHPPGEAHQLINTGATDLIYYVVADNPASDVCHYPDSNKVSVPGQAKPLQIRPTEYFDGEE